MRRMGSIAALIVLSVMISDNLTAQQTSSAAQIVRFGVARTPQMLVNSLSPLRSDGIVSPISSTKTPEQRLASIPAKITFSSKVLHTTGSYKKEYLNSENSASGANLSEVLTPENDGRNQRDLKTFLLEDKLLPSNSSLVLTITD